MRSENPPSFRINDFFDELTRGIRTNTKASDKRSSLKAESIKSKNDFIDAENQYYIHACNDSLYAMPPDVYEGKNELLTNEDYKELFSKFRDRKKEVITNYIKEIKTKTKRKCIFCQKRTGADAIDHFLPQTKYDLFTITPINLMPICSTCNGIKKEYVKEFYHPYFSEINSESLVKCKLVIECDCQGKYNLIPSFRFQPSFNLSNTMNERTKNAFDGLRLEDRYADMATEIIDENIDNWVSTLEEEGEDALVKHLDRILKSNMKSGSYTINSVNVSLFEALLSVIKEDDNFRNLFKKCNWDI